MNWNMHFPSSLFIIFVMFNLSGTILYHLNWTCYDETYYVCVNFP